MSITTDTSGGFGIATDGGSVNLTLGAGCTCLVASIYFNPGGGAPTFTATWNGSAMTQVTSVDIDNASPASWGSGRLANVMFYILNPTTGTHSLSITTAVGRPLGFSASSYNGVIAVGAHSQIGSTSAGTLTNTLTTTAPNSWLVMGATGNDVMTASTGFTARNTQNSFQCAIGDSNGDLSQGSNSIAVNNANNNGVAGVALELISQLPSSVNAGFFNFL